MSARPAMLTIPSLIPHDQAPPGVEQPSATDDFDTRSLPSPTPSEADALNTKGFFARPKLSEWRMWFQRKYWSYWIIGIIALGVTIAFIVLHRRISNALEPFARRLKDLPAGWLIPVGLLIILSFPPLFGHEIVAVLCGVVWGLGIGFGIVVLGTLLGELASFFAFRTFLRRRAERLEHDSLKYGLLSHVIREGGFKIALMARLSAIPPHFLTVIFSTSGMKVWVFTLAAILSLPRQFATVYLGLLFDSNGTANTGQRGATAAIIAVTVIITLAAGWYISKKYEELKPGYITERRRARQMLVVDVNFPRRSEDLSVDMDMAEKGAQEPAILPVPTFDAMQMRMQDQEKPLPATRDSMVRVPPGIHVQQPARMSMQAIATGAPGAMFVQPPQRGFHPTIRQFSPDP